MLLSLFNFVKTNELETKLTNLQLHYVQILYSIKFLKRLMFFVSFFYIFLCSELLTNNRNILLSIALFSEKKQERVEYFGEGS